MIAIAKELRIKARKILVDLKPLSKGNIFLNFFFYINHLFNYKIEKKNIILNIFK